MSPPKELVLSVDGQTNLESDSSDEESEIISQGVLVRIKKNKQTHGISHNVDEKLKTPAYQANIPVVASHDRSDYNEEDNNDFTRKLNEIQLKESNHEDLAQSEVQEGQKDEPDSVNQVSEPSSTKQQPNLVLSVDTHKTFIQIVVMKTTTMTIRVRILILEYQPIVLEILQQIQHLKITLQP